MSGETSGPVVQSVEQVVADVIAAVAPCVGRASWERLRAALLVLAGHDPAAVCRLVLWRWGDGEADPEGLAGAVPRWNALVAGARMRDPSREWAALASTAAEVGGRVVGEALRAMGVQLVAPAPVPPQAPASAPSNDAVPAPADDAHGPSPEQVAAANARLERLAAEEAARIATGAEVKADG